MKRRLTWLLVIGALAAALVVTRSSWLPVPAEWLLVNDAVQPSDVILVLSGQTIWRAQKAARLYREKYATRIVVSGGAESELFLFLTGEHVMEAEIASRVLARLGVPRDAMTLLNGITSTHEEAVAFRDYVRSHSVKSAILVTSHLHSRRARWMFRRVLEGAPIKLEIVEADQPHFTVHNWWQREDAVLTVFNEYLKFGSYLLHY